MNTYKKKKRGHGERGTKSWPEMAAISQAIAD
jgi:hypothetical protein